MPHHLSPLIPVILISFFPSHRQIASNPEREGQCEASLKGKIWWMGIVILTWAFSILLTDSLPAKDEPLITSPTSEENRNELQQVQTILMAGTVQTWLDTPVPPYNVGIT